jgi:hypothetical protein
MALSTHWHSVYGVLHVPTGGGGGGVCPTANMAMEIILKIS